MSDPSQFTHAFSIKFRCFAQILEPVTSAATFFSSFTFQSMNSSTSGWSISTTTIFAALLVVPPDFIAPAERSPIFKKLIRPEDFPPPDRPSPSPRIFEKLEPVPEPYLNSLASLVHRSIIPPSFTRSSSMDWIKHACGCGCSYADDDWVNFLL